MYSYTPKKGWKDIHKNNNIHLGAVELLSGLFITSKCLHSYVLHNKVHSTSERVSSKKRS